MGYLSGPQCNHKGPYERRPEGQTQRRVVMIKAQIGVMPFEDEGGGHNPKDAGGLWKLERQGSRFSTQTSGKNQPCQHLSFSSVSVTLDFGPPELQDNTFILF